MATAFGGSNGNAKCTWEGPESVSAHCCDQTPEETGLKGAKFILAHGLRGFSAGLPYFGDWGEAEHQAEAMYVGGKAATKEAERERRWG